MGKKISSIIVILSTIISVVIMIYSYIFSNNVINGFKSIEILEQEASLNREKIKEESSVGKIETNANQLSCEKVEEGEKEYIETDNIKESDNMESVQDNSIVEDDSNEEDINKATYEQHYNEFTSKEDSVTTSSNKNYNESSNIISNEAISVFKINKNIIPSKISNSDKFKLLKMAKSLSIKDYKQLSKDIKRSDELPAAVDIFSLLQSTLSDSEYKELKDILSPYLKFDLIESTIKNE